MRRRRRTGKASRRRLRSQKRRDKNINAFAQARGGIRV